MFCEKCGTHIEDDSAFCHNCGAKIERINAKKNKLEDNKIKHISCFDAVYVSYKNMDNTLNIINDTSIRMFNKEINVDFDNETFMELVR